ncbi:apolipoprotein N-acyltransferase [Naumannella cuiyingiana]|uniref:Apolipoprotein N-acyltransferase n=1 Tax=Naumannella cuiyingiana TaxID=1347891 RepID=A0A7Z0D5V6_9ACTN|nr:apolipoprotein N-acyltransferase [Naumannella cuiyingiana]
MTAQQVRAPQPTTPRVLVPRLRGPARMGAAALIGLLAGLGWEPTAAWPLTLFGVAALTLACIGLRPRAGFGVGFGFGLGLMAVTVGWTYVIAVPVAAALVAFEALFFGGLGAALTLVTRLPGWPVWAAAAWSLCEFSYSRVPFDGFGWTRLAYVAVDTPLAGLFAFVGVSGVSFLVALAGQGLAALVAAWPDPAARRRVAAQVIVVATAVLLAGLGGRAWQPEPAAGVGAPVRVGIVQGNVDGVGIGAMGRARSVTNNHLSETVGLMARVNAGELPRPDFVLWPENSTDIDPTTDPQTGQIVQAASELTGVPILVGAVMDGPGADERQTAALWWDPHIGITARYNKRNLVPFGEYIPLRQVLLPLVPMLRLVGAQSVPGTEPGLMQVRLGDGRALAIGDVICFELAWDSTVREATSGAQLFVVQSNNATYLRTGQLDQQFAITRARAMETRREVAIATTNALSGFVDRNGTVLWEATPGEPASTVVEMPVREATTPAMAIGAPLTWLLAALGAGAIGVAIARTVLRGRVASTGIASGRAAGR